MSKGPACAARSCAGMPALAARPRVLGMSLDIPSGHRALPGGPHCGPTARPYEHRSMRTHPSELDENRARAPRSLALD